MSKYISIFFLGALVSFLLFFIFGSVFMEGGNPAEEAVYTFGTIIVLFMLFFISQICYLIDLINKKRYSLIVCYLSATGSPNSSKGCLKSNAKESGPCWI